MSSDEPASADHIEARVKALSEAADRARFAGASPRVVAPPDADPDEVAAHVLVAERLGLPLVLGGALHHLHEQRAWEGLWAAQDALARWSFGEAEGRLDRAAAVATDSVLQQRIAVWKLLGSLLRRLVRTHPDETIRGDPSRAVVDLLGSADCLTEAERAHYRAEAHRVIGIHAAARADPNSTERVVWYAVRARLTLAADEPLAALAWCVRLGKLQGDRLPDDPYLHGLLQQARDYALLVLGELDDEAAQLARETTRDVQAWDVYRALMAHLGTALKVDVQREASRFAIVPYRDADA